VRAPTRVPSRGSPQVLVRWPGRGRLRALRRLWAPAARHPRAHRGSDSRVSAPRRVL